MYECEQTRTTGAFEKIEQYETQTAGLESIRLLIIWLISLCAHLSSVLSAREMAGFLTALLHAWLLLQT